MALIKCTECGKDVSDKAAACPNCGNPIKKYATENTTLKREYVKEDVNALKCPKCTCSQLTSNKKGFSGGKAIAGAVLTGGIGLLAGTIGSSSVIITCLKCGYKFKAGDYASETNNFERKRRAEREVNRKIAKGEESYEMAIIMYSLLSLVGVILSVSLLINDWVFFGVVLSIGTLICIGIVALFVSSENDRSNKQKEIAAINAREKKYVAKPTVLPTQEEQERIKALAKESAIQSVNKHKTTI